MKVKRFRTRSLTHMYTCARRGEALYFLRQWVEAKAARQDIKTAEAQLLKAAREYFGLF
jgi:hypothetical protein